MALVHLLLLLLHLQLAEGSVFGGHWKHKIPCSAIGKKNKDTITKVFGFDKESEKKEVHDVRDLFARKVSCKNAPAAEPFGFSGYNVQEEEKDECLHRLFKDESGFEMQPIKLKTMHAAYLTCGKAVWVQGLWPRVQDKVDNLIVKNVLFAARFGFNHQGKINKIEWYDDTLTWHVLGQAFAKRRSQQGQHSETSEKWSLPEVFAPTQTGSSWRRDVGFLMVGFVMGAIVVAVASRIVRSQPEQSTTVFHVQLGDWSGTE